MQGGVHRLSCLFAVTESIGNKREGSHTFLIAWKFTMLEGSNARKKSDVTLKFLLKLPSWEIAGCCLEIANDPWTTAVLPPESVKVAFRPRLSGEHFHVRAVRLFRWFWILVLFSISEHKNVPTSNLYANPHEVDHISPLPSLPSLLYFTPESAQVLSVSTHPKFAAGKRGLLFIIVKLTVVIFPGISWSENWSENLTPHVGSWNIFSADPKNLLLAQVFWHMAF